MKKSQDISINRLNLRLEETKNEINLSCIENETLKKSDMKLKILVDEFKREIEELKMKRKIEIEKFKSEENVEINKLNNFHEIKDKIARDENINQINELNKIHKIEKEKLIYDRDLQIEEINKNYKIEKEKLRIEREIQMEELNTGNKIEKEKLKNDLTKVQNSLNENERNLFREINSFLHGFEKENFTILKEIKIRFEDERIVAKDIQQVKKMININNNSMS